MQKLLYAMRTGKENDPTVSRRAVRARPLLPAAHLALAAGLLHVGDAQADLHAWVLAEQLAGESARACASPVWDGRALGRDRLLINALAGGGGAAPILNFVHRLRAREPQSRLSLLVPAEGPAGFTAGGLFRAAFTSAASRRTTSTGK